MNTNRRLAPLMVLFATAPLAAQTGQTPTTWQECMAQHNSRNNDCCAMTNPIYRASCFETAQAGLENCLDNLPETAPRPQDCWFEYTGQLNACGGSGVCQDEDGQQACTDGAEAFFNWCKGIAIDDGAGGNIVPKWPTPTPPLVFGSAYPLQVTTAHADVTGVSFWLVRLGPKLDGVPKLMHIGDAAPGESWRHFQVWELQADTATWPIGGDERVLLVARADTDGRPVAISHLTLDITFNPDDLNRDGRVDLGDLVKLLMDRPSPERVKEFIGRLNR